jgi:O-antigen/teichoic acid export membrane protein
LKRALLGQPFRFSLPLLPFAAVVWVAAFADRVWIERSFDLTTLGTYSLLLALVTMVTMASHASWNGIQPFLFEELSAKGGPSTRRLQQLARTYFSIPFLVGGALAAGAPLLHALTDEPGYLAVLTFATAGIAVYLTESVSIFLRGLLTHALKPAIISIATTISVAIQFGSYIILIPHFGINGALAGILAGQLILIAILLISLRTKAPQAIPSLKILAPPLILIPLFLLPKLMGHFGWIANLWTGILQFSCIFLPILGYFLKKED